MLSACLILNLREWSDRTLVVAQYTGQPDNLDHLSSIILSFHAATVGRTSSDEFGSDPLDDVHHDQNVDIEMLVMS